MKMTKSVLLKKKKAVFPFSFCSAIQFGRQCISKCFVLSLLFMCVFVGYVIAIEVVWKQMLSVFGICAIIASGRDRRDRNFAEQIFSLWNFFSRAKAERDLKIAIVDCNELQSGRCDAPQCCDNGVCPSPRIVWIQNRTMGETPRRNIPMFAVNWMLCAARCTFCPRAYRVQRWNCSFIRWWRCNRASCVSFRWHFDDGNE